MEAQDTYRKDKTDQRWFRLMKLGAKTGCHQRPDRSFYLGNYQMPVCARCSGVLLGYIIAIPVFFLFGFRLLFSVSGSLIMFLDWLLQERGIKESSNGRRLATGVLGGFGIMSLQLSIIKHFILYFSEHKE